jgi:mono/diheme cytochrome c family protein
MRRWLVAMMVGVACLPPLAHAQARPDFDLKDPAIIEAGRVLYNQRCAGRCHGIDGQEGFDGPILVGRPHLEPGYVFGTLIVGRPGSAMPGWVGRIPDDELWKIIAFVSSLGDAAKARVR